MKDLILIGAGGFGREVLAWARQTAAHGRAWRVKGFLDDNPEALAAKRVSVPWLGRVEDHAPAEREVFLCPMGTPALRRRCSEIIQDRGGQFTTLIHPTAVLGDEVELGDGVILCPYSVVSGHNRLGRGVVVNLHSTVDHDATVGDWTQINCHCDLTGGVTVGSEVWFGSRVSIAPGLRVGDKAYLGIGSVILRDVEPGAKVFGVPAKRIE